MVHAVKSTVWTYFDILEDDNMKAMCKVCQEKGKIDLHAMKYGIKVTVIKLIDGCLVAYFYIRCSGSGSNVFEKYDVILLMAQIIEFMSFEIMLSDNTLLLYVARRKSLSYIFYILNILVVHLIFNAF